MPALSGELLVGIDIGTTVSKAAVVDVDGFEIAHAARPTPWRRVDTGAECDPRTLAATAIAVAREALDGARPAAVGVCSMAETGVLLGSAGEPVAPAVAWHDTRGADDEAALLEAFDRDEFIRRTGVPPRRILSLVKLRGLVRSGRRGTRWLNVSEWVVRCLGGDEAAELSLTSRSGFLDVEARAPWDEALAFAGVDRRLLPELVPAGTALGRATEPGLEDAVLTVGGHDHLCAAVGAGATRDGDLFDSNGSAEALIAALEPPVAADDVVRAVAGGVTSGWHVFGGRRSLLGGFPCGLVLQSFLDLLGITDDERPSLSEAALAGPRGRLRVTDVTGDATLSGIGPGVTPGAAWRAAIEATQGHALQIRRTIEAVAGPARRRVAAGGWLRDDAYAGVKAEILGELERPPVREAGARGAALLAGLAAGVYTSIDELPAPVPAREAVGRA